MDEELLLRAMVDLLITQRDRARRRPHHAPAASDLTTFLEKVEAHLSGEPDPGNLAERVAWTARGRELARESLARAAGPAAKVQQLG